jgi:hypothetical protein
MVFFGCSGRSVRSSNERGEAGGSPLVEIERVSARGFCIEDGALLRARVEADAAGSLTFSGTRHLGWEEPPVCPSFECELTQPVGPTVLSDADRAELEGMLARLPLVPCVGRVDPGCDPCLETRFTVDGTFHPFRACMSECDESLLVLLEIAEFFDVLAAR